MRKAMQDIGIKRFIKIVGLDEIINQVGIDEVIDAVGIDILIDKIGIDIIFRIPKKKAMKFIEQAKKMGRITEVQAVLLKQLYNIS